jgi:hypothetical protein
MSRLEWNPLSLSASEPREELMSRGVEYSFSDVHERAELQPEPAPSVSDADE